MLMNHVGTPLPSTYHLGMVYIKTIYVTKTNHKMGTDQLFSAETAKASSIKMVMTCGWGLIHPFNLG